ncbi:MAG: hypothetical protein MK120_01910 [Puniceicoccaceae bacterium]|nr:hypothetical protein [Puniceicoccaceae bacterium]
MQASEKDLVQVTALFEQLGAQTEQASVLAKQLLKRAEQLSIERKISLVESTDSLLRQVIRARQGLPPEVES